MKKLILRLTAASLCALAPLPIISQAAFADPYNDAIQAKARKDYSTAYNLFSPLANSGNSAAQFEIALLYGNGLYGAKSEQKPMTAMWLRRSADGGNLQAQKEMSILWDLSREYGVSYKESEKYTRMAAEQGDASRQYSVGLSYGHKKNYTQARFWHMKAAAQGYEPAAKALEKLPTAPALEFSIYNRSNVSGTLTAAQLKKAKDEGFAAYVAGNYTQSIRLWSQAAEAGNAYAQTNLGIQYVNAQGTERSKEKALFWLEKAMAQNYEHAFRVVAELHIKGIFFPKSKQKAFEFYKKSSDLGSAQGAYATGGISEDWGDLSGALALYKRGADGGHPDAQATLGLIYDGTRPAYKDSKIVTVDLEEAMKWYLQAAQQDFHYAIYQVGYNYKTGTGVPKSLASAQYWHKRGARMGMGESMMSLSAADQKEIRNELYQLAKTRANNGDAKAQYTLASAYKYGEGIEKSAALSEHWLGKAAAQNMPEAMADLATIYDDGLGNPRNAQKAKALYMKLAANRLEPRTVVTRALKAYDHGDYELALALGKPYADSSNKFAQNMMGFMHLFGRGVPKSVESALAYYQQASNAGLADAQHNIGFLYEYNRSDPTEAAIWYRKAANQEHSGALNALALMYSNGNGVPKNQPKAIELYGRAAAAGDIMAADLKRTVQGEQRLAQEARARTQANAQARHIRQQPSAKKLTAEQKEQRQWDKVIANHRASLPTYTYQAPKKKRNKWSLRTLFEDVANQGYINSSSYNAYNSTSSNSNYSGYSSGSTSDSSSATRSPYATYTPPPKVSPYEYRYKGAWTIDGPRH